MWDFGSLTLSAVSDVVVHLNKFENVDLWERGVYCVRVQVLKRVGGQEEPCTPYAFSAAPATLHSTARGVVIQDAAYELSTPAFIDDSSSAFYSRSFLVRYRNESMDLNELVQFRLMTNVSERGFSNDVIVRFELCMTEVTRSESAAGWEQSGTMSVIATQVLALEPNQLVSPGLHAFYPLNFDDAHFCHLGATIHSAMLDLKFRNPPRRPQRKSMLQRAASTGGLPTPPPAARRSASQRGAATEGDQPRRHHTLVELLFSNPTPEINAEIRSLAARGVASSKSFLSDDDILTASNVSLDALVSARADQLSALLVSSLEASYKSVASTLRTLSEATLTPEQWEAHPDLAQSRPFAFPATVYSDDMSTPLPAPGTPSTTDDARSGRPGPVTPATPVLDSAIHELREELLQAGAESEGAEEGEGEGEQEETAPPGVNLSEEGFHVSVSNSPQPEVESKADDQPHPLSERLQSLTPETITFALAHDANFGAQQCFFVWNQLLQLLLIAPQALADRLRCEWEQQTAQRWSYHVFSRTTNGDVASQEAELLSTSAVLRDSPMFANPSVLPVQDMEVFGEGSSSLPVIVLDQYFSDGELAPQLARQDSVGPAPVPMPHPWGEMGRSLSDWSGPPPCELSHAFLTGPCPRCQHEPHLIVYHHGFQGTSFDLRHFRNQLSVFFPQAVTLLSSANERDSSSDLQTMGHRLAREIIECVQNRAPFLMTRGKRKACGRLSFVGHSIGSLVIRAALADPLMAPYLSQLHTFVSLSSPHLGALHGSALVSTGMWAMKLLRRAPSLDQLQLADGNSGDLRESFLFRLSHNSCLKLFKHVILLSSHQDQYVPFFSARVEAPRGPAAAGLSEDKRALFETMASELLQGVDKSRLVRLNVDHIFASSTVDTFIGRAAHIRLLDDPQLIFLLVFVLHEFFASDR